MRKDDDDFSIAALLPISEAAGYRKYRPIALYPVKQLVEWFGGWEREREKEK